jgi:hypothetical protein
VGAEAEAVGSAQQAGTVVIVWGSSAGRPAPRR